MAKADLNPLTSSDYRVKVLHNIFIDEQDFTYAVLSGMAATMISALIWSYLYPYLIMPLHLVAFVLAYGIGACMQYFGRGYRFYYGLMAAFFTLLSFWIALIWNLLTVVAIQQKLDIFQAAATINGYRATLLLLGQQEAILWLIYPASAALAYWASLRRAKPNDLARVGLQ